MSGAAWRQERELRKLLQAYLIMGSNNCRKDPVRVLAEAIAGGITMFQYREKCGRKGCASPSSASSASRQAIRKK